MPIDMNGITLEDVIAERQRRASAKGQSSKSIQPQNQAPGIIPNLLNKIDPSGNLSTTISQGVKGWQGASGYSTPDNDYSKLYAQEAIKKQFEKKSPYDDLIERGKAAGAAREIGDRETFDALQMSPTGTNLVSQSSENSSIIGEQGQYLDEIDSFTKKPTARSMEARSALKTRQNEDSARSRAEIKTKQNLVNIGKSAEIISADLDDVLTTWKDIPKHITGPVQGRTSGQVLKFLQTGGGEKATEYDDTADFIMANISRQLGGERGVLTDRDIARIKKALPLLRDKESLANSKIARIKRFIGRRIQQAQGGELDGFGGNIEDELSAFDNQEIDTGDVDTELSEIDKRLAELGG